MKPQQTTLRAWLGVALLFAALPGCAAFRGSGVPSNPLFVRTDNSELVWERSVDVLHENLFEIERENRLNGLIESKYKTGAGLLEPWHSDSASLRARLESTLQSIRRKAFITVTPAEGGFFVAVEAHKELEDVTGAANSAGASTFLENDAKRRDLESVLGQASPSGWIPVGRDPDLERLLLVDLQRAFR